MEEGRQAAKTFIGRWASSGAAERANTPRVADLLETLADLGQARKMDDGRYTTG